MRSDRWRGIRRRAESAAPGLDIRFRLAVAARRPFERTGSGWTTANAIVTTAEEELYTVLN